MNMQDFSAAYNQTVRAGVQKITSFGSVSDGNACGDGMFIVQTSFRPTYRGGASDGRA